MKISDFLSPADVALDVCESDKARLLQQLSSQAAAKVGLSANEVCTQIIKREELGSTGVGNGVALPHARLRGLTNLASSAGVRLLTRTTCGCEQVIIRLPFCRMLRAFATRGTWK